MILYREVRDEVKSLTIKHNITPSTFPKYDHLKVGDFVENADYLNPYIICMGGYKASRSFFLSVLDKLVFDDDADNNAEVYISNLFRKIPNYKPTYTYARLIQEHFNNSILENSSVWRNNPDPISESDKKDFILANCLHSFKFNRGTMPDEVLFPDPFYSRRSKIEKAKKREQIYLRDRQLSNVIYESQAVLINELIWFFVWKMLEEVDSLLLLLKHMNNECIIDFRSNPFTFDIDNHFPPILLEGEPGSMEIVDNGWLKLLHESDNNKNHDADEPIPSREDPDEHKLSVNLGDNQIYLFVYLFLRSLPQSGYKNVKEIFEDIIMDNFEGIETKYVTNDLVKHNLEIIKEFTHRILKIEKGNMSPEYRKTYLEISTNGACFNFWRNNSKDITKMERKWKEVKNKYQNYFDNEFPSIENEYNRFKSNIRQYMGKK